MSGHKLKVQEPRQSRAWPSAALCVSLAVSPNIRSNHPQLWSRRAEAVSWNKNQTRIHKYTDVFWKLREAMISLLWPNTVGLERIWIASEDTASYPEPIKTGSHSFWQESVWRLDAEGLGCPKHGAGQPCHFSGLETEVCIHLWQSSLIPMLLSLSVSELVHPGKKLHPKTLRVKRLVFLLEIQRQLYYQRHLIRPGAIVFSKSIAASPFLLQTFVFFEENLFHSLYLEHRCPVMAEMWMLRFHSSYNPKLPLWTELHWPL